MLKKIFYKIIYLFLLTLIIVFIINVYIFVYSKNFIKDINNIENIKVGLVLGAGIKGNKEPTDILKDRLKAAYLAYKKGVINKILLSGDNSKVYHNEPNVMKNYLLKLGVQKQDLYLDYAGFDTYDSIYRAKYIFGLDKLIIFTQKYHLYRAVYIAKRLGIKAFGVETDFHNYINKNIFIVREIFSRVKAFLEVELLKTKPKFLGEKIKIN